MSWGWWLLAATIALPVIAFIMADAEDLEDFTDSP